MGEEARDGGVDEGKSFAGRLAEGTSKVSCGRDGLGTSRDRDWGWIRDLEDLEDRLEEDLEEEEEDFFFEEESFLSRFLETSLEESEPDCLIEEPDFLDF